MLNSAYSITEGVGNWDFYFYLITTTRLSRIASDFKINAVFTFWCRISTSRIIPS